MERGKTNMKYLKLFEAKGEHTFTVVTFESGESVSAIYVDDVLLKYGDYYHDKINDWIKGFLEGVRWSGINLEESKFTCGDDKISEDVCDGGIPPQSLSDVPR
jgi:hypothetical protein